jgi:vacuolar-type H+-ATPase subunit I/STV1
MKKLLLFSAAVLFMQISFAQRSGEMEWQKQKLPATIIDIPQSASVTEAAILQKLSQLGYKPKESKGVYSIKGARIPEISAEMIDIYFKVDRKSRKDKDESVVYFVVSKGYENFVKSTDDAALNQNIQNYTRGFIPLAEAEGLEREIKAQEETLKSAEKKAADLQDESESLQKRLKKLQDDIEENKKNIEKQKAEIDNQRRALDILKAKRKS